MARGRRSNPPNVVISTHKLSSYAENVTGEFVLKAVLDIIVCVWNVMKRYRRNDMNKGLNVPGLKLPWETVDAIVMAAMLDQYTTIKTELYEHHVNGAWMHPEDVIRSKEMLVHIEAIIDYYGGGHV
jgi:hypothetical protein